MADARKPTQRYLSGRVKIAGTEALSSDRHLYVDPGQVEPNLGYVGEKSIPLSSKSPSKTVELTIDIGRNKVLVLVQLASMMRVLS